MAIPTLYGDPDNMANYKYLPNNSAGDYGGVHINSGISNKAFSFYLTATNSAVGIAKAEQIYYRALCNYLTSSSNFSAARAALAKAAADLYGSTEMNAVNSAWTAVGVN